MENKEFCVVIASMQPNEDLITITDTEPKIVAMLQDLVFQPRLKALEWSQLTFQTPNMKIGYPGQHLVSLITGMAGERTGARGNDLIDGTEVKSCSRIDPLDSCKDCKFPVARIETACANCGSENLKRSNDSKWLFTIRSEEDLETLTQTVDRVMLVIGYYPEFDEGNFDIARINAYEIWTKSERNTRFTELMTNYYNNIYLEHRRVNPRKTPAPKNFWPFQYQFYLSNPIEVFSCEITDMNTDPQIEITHHLNPAADRATVASVDMPPEILKIEEFTILSQEATQSEIEDCLVEGVEYNEFIELVAEGDKSKVCELFSKINEPLKDRLPLRDTDRIAVAGTAYRRRTH